MDFWFSAIYWLNDKTGMAREWHCRIDSFLFFLHFSVSRHTFGIIQNYITSKNWYWSFPQACLAKWELSIRLARPHMFNVVYMSLYQEWCNTSLLKWGEEWLVNTMYKGWGTFNYNVGVGRWFRNWQFSLSKYLCYVCTENFLT